MFPPLLGVMERAKAVGNAAGEDGIKVQIPDIWQNMLQKKNGFRRSDMQKATQKLEILRKESETIAR